MIKFINISGYGLIFMMFLKICQIRYMNSHLTETQLLMSEWDAWLAIALGCIAGVTAITARREYF